MYISLHNAIVGLYNVQDIEVYMQFFVHPLNAMFLKYGVYIGFNTSKENKIRAVFVNPDAD